jgi:hypothetical protein
MKVLEAGSIKKTRSVKSEKQREKNTQLLSECKKKSYGDEGGVGNSGENLKRFRQQHQQHHQK